MVTERENKMKCPCCKKELIIGGQKRLETLSEHVFDPNGNPSLKDFYICNNFLCDCSALRVMWDQWGGFYAGKNWKEAQDIKFIDNNDGAFGSFERKLNVETGKHDEEFYFPKVFGWRIKIEYEYKSNEDGDILSRKLKPILIHNNAVYISGVRMLIYSIKSHYVDYLRIGKIEDDFQYPKYRARKDWWRWVAPFVLRIIDRKNFKKEKA